MLVFLLLAVTFFSPQPDSSPALAGIAHVAFRQGAGEFKNNRNIFSGLFIQDNYRVTRRLTVNLGLRYEPTLPWRA